MGAFPPFRPDAGELQSSTLSNVTMLGPSLYGPRPTLSTAPGAAALAAAPRGVFGAFLPNGTFQGFGATSTKVYTLGSDYAWTALAPTFTVPTDDDEAMAQFGVYMLASNTTDGVYAYNMDTPAGLNAVSGAPAARYMFPANNQMVYLGSGANLVRLTVSGFGNHANFTNNGFTRQDMQTGGAFTGGGDLGFGRALLLQLRSVKIMEFGNAGGGALFSLTELAGDVGCVHPRAQVVYNGIAYFLHTDGFWSCDGASKPIPIGAGKVNKWFLARCSDLKKVYFAVDPKNTLVRIRYAASGDGSTSTVYNSILDYNWAEGEFIPGTESTSALFRMGTPGYTLDTISAAFGVLDNWSQFPLDSAFWQGGNFRLAGLNSSYKLAFFDGGNAAATLETATEGEGVSKLVNWLEPLTDDPSATVQLGVKDMLSSSMAFGTATSLQASGRAGVRGRGKWQRARLNHAASATWTQDSAIGIVDPVAGGRR